MPKKTGGMPYMVYTSPKKGQDGRNIVFVRPEGGQRMKLTIEEIDAYCAKFSMMRSGELQLVLREFMHWAAEWIVPFNFAYSHNSLAYRHKTFCL